MPILKELLRHPVVREALVIVTVVVIQAVRKRRRR